MVGLSLRWVNHADSIQGRSGADPCSYPVRGIVLDTQKLYIQNEWGFSVHSPPSLLVLLPFTSGGRNDEETKNNQARNSQKNHQVSRPECARKGRSPSSRGGRTLQRDSH